MSFSHSLHLFFNDFKKTNTTKQKPTTNQPKKLMSSDKDGSNDHSIPYMGGLCIVQEWTGRIKVSATRWLMLSPELFREIQH